MRLQTFSDGRNGCYITAVNEFLLSDVEGEVIYFELAYDENQSIKYFCDMRNAVSDVILNYDIDIILVNSDFDTKLTMIVVPCYINDMTPRNISIIATVKLIQALHSKKFIGESLFNTLKKLLPIE